MKRRITAMLIVMAMLLGMMPGRAIASDSTFSVENTEKDYSYLDDMTINELKELDIEIHKRIPYVDSSSNESIGNTSDGSIVESSAAEETPEDKCTIDDIYGKWMSDDMAYAMVISPNGTLYYYYLVDNAASIGGTGTIQEYTNNGFILYNEGGEFEYSNENDSKTLTCVATGIIPAGTIMKQYEDMYTIDDLRFDWVGKNLGKHIIIRDNDFSVVGKTGGSATDLVSSLLLIGEYLYNFRFGLLKIEKQGDSLILTSENETYECLPLDDAN